MSRLLEGQDTATVIAHEDFTHTYTDGKAAPIMTAVLTPEQSLRVEDLDLTQSLRFPDADTVRRDTTDCLVVTQIMGIACPPPDRVRAFHVGLCAAIEQLRPIAIWSPHSQQLVRPEDVLAERLAAVVNVRLFQPAGDDGAIVMDTLGMHVLQLPDLQCHFRGINPPDMFQVLRNLAEYLVDAGDVIADGNTITGVEGRERWRCQHEMSLIGPERIVLDIDVGSPHAAGVRRRRRFGRWGR